MKVFNRVVIRQLLCAACLGGLALPTLSVAASEEPEPSVLYVAPGDADMANAVAGAKATLGNVLERAATGGIPMEALQLKVAIPKEGGGHENIYVEGIVQIDETTFEGLLANTPHALPGKSRGDRHRFTQDEITDWLFVVNGQMHGAYTLRVTLPFLPADQAARFRAMLAPLP